MSICICYRPRTKVRRDGNHFVGVCLFTWQAGGGGKEGEEGVPPGQVPLISPKFPDSPQTWQGTPTFYCTLQSPSLPLTSPPPSPPDRTGGTPPPSLAHVDFLVLVLVCFAFFLFKQSKVWSPQMWCRQPQLVEEKLVQMRISWYQVSHRKTPPLPSLHQN